MELLINFSNISIFWPALLIFALTIATIIATRWEHVANYTLSSGFISGAFAGMAMTLFLLLIAAPLISHPISNSIKVLSLIIQGQNTINPSQINFLPLAITAFFLITASSFFGAVYSSILGTEKMGRVIMGGILFSLAVWASLQYIILPYSFPLILENGLPPIWLATGSVIYGLVLGELIAYSHHWRNILDP